jgi:hypothetical protein
MEEEQVQRKIPVADLQRVFRTDKTEVASQLNEKILQLIQQAAVQIGLRVDCREAEELDSVGIPEDA